MSKAADARRREARRGMPPKPELEDPGPRWSMDQPTEAEDAAAERAHRMRRLRQAYAPGERVRAADTIVFGTGVEIAEGTIGRVQGVNVHGCAPLVTVAWEGRGGDGQPPHVTHPCSIESLEPADRELT